MSGDRPHFYDFGSFRVDPAQRVLLRDGRPVALQPKAFEILLFLVRNPGRLITKEELLSAIWPELVVEESNLSQNIFLLRKALGDGESGHRCIVTLPRRGYQFAVEHGYDLGDYANGEMVSDWWGFTWMILAEKWGLLTSEQRALAWRKHDARLLARENVVGLIRDAGS